MATSMPTPDYIIIWLDQYIGLPESNVQLKTGFRQQADPENVLPESPLDKDIGQAIQFRNALDESFANVPKNLEAFSDKEGCFRCMDENLKNKKRIFFITSGTKGAEIVSDLIGKYSSLKYIYVFCGNVQAHLDWTYDCLDAGIECIVKDFHTDLLVRLLRDVAEYFISEGDNELKRSEQLAYSAKEYFQWSKILLDRANKFDMKKIYTRLDYVENRLEFAEGLLEKMKDEEDKEKPSHPH